MRPRSFIALGLIGMFALMAIAQQSPTKSLSTTEAGRFKFGKSIYVLNDRANSIAFDTINSDLQGWGRFTSAASADKADLIVEISSVENGGVSVSSKTGYGSDGRPNSSSSTNKDLSASSVSLKVMEAKSKRELWSGTEKVKSAFKKKTGGNNLLDAAERLFERFHNYVEPPEN
jgi:hypothetical protein